MDYDFLNVFYPKIASISNRDGSYWELNQVNYTIDRTRTVKHVLGYVYNGEGQIELNAKCYSLHSGAIFYIPPGSQMKITTGKKSTVKFYSIQFFYGKLRWEGETIQWGHDLKDPILDDGIIYFEESPMLLDKYQNLFAVWDRKGIGFEWFSKMQFQQLLHMLFQMVQNSSEHLQRNASIIQETMDYIRGHLKERLDRAVLADRVPMSAGHFTTLFKQYSGYSLIEYITNQRIDRAKQLLVETRLPIYKIAEEVGFADSFYFTRRFGKETGTSPREYRESQEIDI